MREHRDASRDALDREVWAPFGVSLTRNGRSETAKFLPACKAVPPTTFAVSAKVVGGEPQEVVGDNHPRYMTITNFAHRRQLSKLNILSTVEGFIYFGRLRMLNLTATCGG